MAKQESIVHRLNLRATDVLILSTLAFFSLLTLGFQSRVEGWLPLLQRNLLVMATYAVFVQMARRVPGKALKFGLRVVPVTLTFGYLFEAVDKLQLILHGRWMDGTVLRIEETIFGIQPTLWLQTFTKPAVTEWMMFSYLFYFVLYPLICGIILFRVGERAMEDFLFTLSLTNVLCDLGFILFPVAGPMVAIGAQFSVPLDGYVCTWLGELVRTRLQFPGGSIPSPHCAAATVMWVMAFRHHRPTFWFLAPVVLSLYVSTFYCRYHYLSDAVLGIATAAVALTLAPKLTVSWEQRIHRIAAKAVSSDTASR